MISLYLHCAESYGERRICLYFGFQKGRPRVSALLLHCFEKQGSGQFAMLLKGMYK
jgi:hypothetical protein